MSLVRQRCPSPARSRAYKRVCQKHSLMDLAGSSALRVALLSASSASKAEFNRKSAPGAVSPSQSPSHARTSSVALRHHSVSVGPRRLGRLVGAPQRAAGWERHESENGVQVVSAAAPVCAARLVRRLRRKGGKCVVVDVMSASRNLWRPVSGWMQLRVPIRARAG